MLIKPCKYINIIQHQRNIKEIKLYKALDFNNKSWYENQSYPYKEEILHFPTNLKILFQVNICWFLIIAQMSILENQTLNVSELRFSC